MLDDRFYEMDEYEKREKVNSIIDSWKRNVRTDGEVFFTFEGMVKQLAELMNRSIRLTLDEEYRKLTGDDLVRETLLNGKISYINLKNFYFLMFEKLELGDPYKMGKGFERSVSKLLMDCYDKEHDRLLNDTQERESCRPDSIAFIRSKTGLDGLTGNQGSLNTGYSGRFGTRGQRVIYDKNPAGKEHTNKIKPRNPSRDESYDER